MKVRKDIGLTLIILLIFLCPVIGNSQSINHWKAIILAENEWKYQVGIYEPPATWIQADFDDSSWLVGPGGIGYGDDDDSTIIDPAFSVYMRKEFSIIDTSEIFALYLHADYDDAFVAYLNGIEICRANIGTSGNAPAYNEPAFQQREATLYRGGLPEVYPIAKSLFNNGNNLLAVQVHNTDTSSSDLSSSMFLIAGMKNDSNNYQPVPSWFTSHLSSSNLPIFVINTNGRIILDEPKITATLGVIDNNEGNLNFLSDSFNVYNGKIGIEKRGHSSQLLPKNNYGFETRLADGSNNNVSLLGLPIENDWILHGPYSDKSLMRNVLSYHIGRLMGEYASRTRWCELIIDGDYKGLYVLMEKIKQDNNRVNISKLKETDTTGVELTGGYIFSIDREEEGKGWISPNYYKPFYKYQDPKYDVLAPQQKTYIQNHITFFEQLVDSSNSSEDYSQYLDIPSFVNYWLATEIFKNLDNYKFSFFMYKTRDDKGGKIHFGPLWDINLGYGNYNVDDPGPEGWSYIWAQRSYLQPWIIDDLSEDPDIQNRIHCRWKELREDQLRTDSLLNFIDTQAAIIEDAQTRNFTRWPILGNYVWPNVFVGNTYEEELNYLKTWLSERLEWMDNNMIGTCGLSAILQEDDPALIIPCEHKLYQNYPNPFNPTTSITYDIGLRADVSVDIFDLSGNKIQSIYKGNQEAGTYSLNFSPDRLTSGVYFYRLQVNNWFDTKKMLYMK